MGIKCSKFHHIIQIRINENLKNNEQKLISK